MPKILMYCTAVCPYCVLAERLLRARGVTEIEKIRVDLQPESRRIMMEITGCRTVPQIFIGTRLVGTYDNLVMLEHSGELSQLLNS
ncbi:Glutaredoxin [Candidatus Nitrotoga sp. BS]|uniref:glutaredoxin domain-containing protein n=1 Tax=Candidatus Nitrotoga sp. BS TaxID=2890408 RepID=UPI001EF1A159|nr:glutaredoxin domain-containing protein [Candidatus Nitrotoga sp. BS]CAH1211802.1 Glutaredoxin [Candidatus Nitrotoga sp. BS]